MILYLLPSNNMRVGTQMPAVRLNRFFPSHSEYLWSVKTSRWYCQASFHVTWWRNIALNTTVTCCSSLWPSWSPPPLPYTVNPANTDLRNMYYSVDDYYTKGRFALPLCFRDTWGSHWSSSRSQISLPTTFRTSENKKLNGLQLHWEGTFIQSFTYKLDWK